MDSIMLLSYVDRICSCVVSFDDSAVWDVKASVGKRQMNGFIRGHRALVKIINCQWKALFLRCLWYQTKSGVPTLTRFSFFKNSSDLNKINGVSIDNCHLIGCEGISPFYFYLFSETKYQQK